MANIKLDHIYKVYPNGVKAVSDFTMDIKDKEFIVFVGPSGCGKSTTLRMIAGLEDISAGELYIDDRIVNDVEPKDRDIAMVFQNYALYPHMTVYENMAFGLQLRHVPTEEIHERVLWAANILGLTDYLDRKPRAMSGGQRQRVALGRAILRNPKVMLLDEPLSNLDAKLRAQMRSEIAKLHQDLQTTFIYVTHDQVEAMTLGTRVVVMKLGEIQQIDSPKNLYDYPQNKFVAGFIGTPQMNFFQATLLRKCDQVEIKFEWSDNKLMVDANELIKVQPYYLDGKHKVWFGIRCEDISLLGPGDQVNPEDIFNVKISHFEELGNETLIYGDINMNGDGFKETSTRIIIKALNSNGLHIGDVVKAKLNLEKAHFFDINSEVSIVPRIPTLNVISCKINGHELTFDGNTLTLPKVVEVKEGDGQLYLPINALSVDQNGKVNAKVIKIEQVEDKKLAYLKLNERVLFLLVGDDVKVGDEVKLNIDITQITIKDGEEVLVSTLKKYNEISSTFVNFVTANTNEKNKYNPILNSRIEEVNKSFDEKIKEVNAKYDALIKENSSKDLAAIKEVNNKKIADLTQETNAKLKELDTNYKKNIAEVKKEHKVNKKQVVLKVKEEQERIKREENESYKKFLKVNKDKDVYHKRKAEHQDFKENFPKERENLINKAIDGEALNFETALNEIKAPYKRDKKILKNNYKTTVKALKDEYNIIEVLNKERNEELSRLTKQKKVDLAKAKQIFFLKINGHLYQSPDTISNKMIQGLGTKVFVKDFILEIPNDKIRVSDEGLKATVESFLDYGDKKFVICNVKEEDGSEHEFYVLNDKEIAKGTEIHLTFDLIDTHITEKSMNLRIY